MKSFVGATVVALLIAVVRAELPCHEVLVEMKSRIEAGMLGVPVPRCEENGDWSPIQCISSSGMCQCVHPNGDVLAQPSRRLTTCACFKERHEIVKNIRPGVHIPQCDEQTGYFKTLQCRGLYCWCTEKTTGESMSDPVHIDNVAKELKHCA